MMSDSDHSDSGRQQTETGSTGAEMAFRRRLLIAMLDHVPFDGWTSFSLRAAARDVGADELAVEQAFPDGILGLIAFFSEETDRNMAQAVQARGVDNLRIHDRVIAAVRIRLEQLEDQKDSIRRALAYLARPHHVVRATGLLHRTVDEIWRLAGDQSTDINYYSKRSLLAGVYTTTLLYWLDDRSEGHEDSWAFLQRRIMEVVAVIRRRRRLSESLSNLSDPLQTFRRWSGARV